MEPGYGADWWQAVAHAEALLEELQNLEAQGLDLGGIVLDLEERLGELQDEAVDAGSPPPARRAS
jgi:hypothetical protein